MKILIIIPESEFCPPTNGGSLRIYHLLRQLGMRYEVHAVTGQSAASLNGAQGSWRLPESIHFYSTLESPAPRDCLDLLPARLTKALRYRWRRRSWQGPASAVFLDLAHLVERVLMNERIDAVIFEHIEAMTLAPLVKQYQPKAVRILDAHNIDHRLIQQAWQAKPNEDRLKHEMERVKRIETSLESEIHSVIACSDDDRDQLVAINSGRIHGFTVPNGVDTTALSYDTNPTKRIQKTLLFCGSLDYEPNADGLRWFYHEIWPLVRMQDPEIRMRIIGRGSENQKWIQKLVSDPQVDFIGTVDDVSLHYHQSSISIVPLRMGSGTRLKILEAMALGTPVVSTTIGAEGIDGQSGSHLERADDPESFAAAISRLLTDQPTYDACRIQSRQLVVRQYDWRIAGDRLCEAMHATALLTYP